MTPDTQHLARADAADAILQHPLIIEALNDYERTLTDAWKQSKARAAHEREELHRMLQAAGHFRAYLTQVIVTGKLIRAKTRPASPMERALDAARGVVRGRR
ncbi:MAG: hypothetical protein L6Q68_03055 [Aquabacterium sp.]|nr:hypothetical protein [Aquabacterium sp.]